MMKFVEKHPWMAFFLGLAVLSTFTNVFGTKAAAAPQPGPQPQPLPPAPPKPYLGKSIVISPTTPMNAQITAYVGDVISIVGIPPYDAQQNPQGFAFYATPPGAFRSISAADFVAVAPSGAGLDWGSGVWGGANAIGIMVLPAPVGP